MIGAVDKYGDAIEYDLHDRGLDLIDFFRGKHSWRKLANILSRLPVSSAFREAQLDDPEYAAWAASQPEGPPASPRVSEWTPERAELVAIYDRLGEVVAAVIASAGGKPPRVKPSPRPTTAIDKARQRQARKRMDDLAAELRDAQTRWEAGHAAGN